MPKPTNVPTSYDDLVRATVPLPDSSHRPSHAEVEEAETHAARLEAIHGALRSLGVDTEGLDLVVDGGRITAEGTVASGEARRRIVEALSAHPGVHTVVDLLRVA